MDSKNVKVICLDSAEQLKREIAERSRAEDRIRLIIDTIPVMAWTVRPDGIVDFLNQRWMDYAGLSLEQYVADPMGPIHPQDIPRVMEEWQARMPLGEGYDDEMRLRRADGEYRWFLVRTAPLRDESGTVVKWYGVCTDIEDRKRTEEALGASEARLQAAVDAADIGLWDWDLVSGKILWLGHHEKLFGFSPGEFDGSYSNFEERIHPEDLEQLNRIVQRARDDRSEYVHEYRVISPDGSIHWITARGRFVYNETGQPGRMYGAVLDITERKRAEETVRKAEERFRALIENSADGITLINSEGEVVYASPALGRIFGLTMEEVQTLRLDLIHPDDHDMVLNAWNELRATPGKLLSLQYRFRYKDGTWRWLDVTAHSLFSDPSVQALVVNFRDITERKRVEEKLSESESQLAEAQRLAHIGSWSWDFRTGAITWSDELYRILGLQPQDAHDGGVATSLLALPDLMEFLHPEDRDLAMSGVESTLKSGETYNVYHRILRRGGEERIVHSIGSVVSDELGTPIRMFGATQDVTERKRAEEELKATSEQLRALSTRLQSAREDEARRMLAVQETERQHLARELHDEIGQLLTSLRLLLKPKGDESPGAVKTRFERSRAMVDDLLGKVRELSFDLRPADLDQLGLLPALLKFFARFTEQTGLLVDFKHKGIEGRFTSEVETAAYRIVQEALTNVARHAGVAGAILRVWSDASMLNLKIEDRGRGFDADATLKALRTSGLRGMQERAMLLGGRMTIESSPVSGTTITAELPLSSTGSAGQLTRDYSGLNI